jgi:hypothetical protein
LLLFSLLNDKPPVLADLVKRLPSFLFRGWLFVERKTVSDDMELLAPVLASY